VTVHIGRPPARPVAPAAVLWLLVDVAPYVARAWLLAVLVISYAMCPCGGPL